MNITSKIKIFFGLTFLVLSYNSCRKDYEQVPYVPVNIRLELFAHLTFMGPGETVLILPDEDNYGYIRFNGENRNDIHLTSKVYGNGIILYRGDLGFSAYDRTCTYLPETNYCGLELDASGLLPTCPCCGSKFIALTGQAADGSKAYLDLKPYRTNISNGTLIITNY